MLPRLAAVEMAHPLQRSFADPDLRPSNAGGHPLVRGAAKWTRRQSAILGRQGFYRAGMIRYGEAVGENKSLILVQDEAGSAE